MSFKTVYHVFDPVYDSQSKVLILGTMPSPKSRENGFYYSHPQNRFWRVISDVLGQNLPVSNEEKTEFLLRNHIALWDVLHACRIEGADDGSIRDPEPNDIGRILETAPVKAVFTTGKKATELYQKFCLPDTGMPSIYLPSTSPANCRYFTYEGLTREYQILKQYL